MEMETNFLNSLNVEVNGRDIRVNATDVISVQDDTSTQIIDFVLDKNEISYDLSLLTAFIVYQPASASGARFEICKKTVEDSNIVVRWIIKKEATFSTGKLRFQLVFTDGSNPGVESAHRWATKIVTVTIPETLTTGQYAVPTEPIIEQMMEIAASVVEAGDKVSRAEEAAISAEEAAARAENAADSIQEAVDANKAAQEAKNAAVSASQNAQLAADTVQAIVANNESYTKQESDYKYTVAPRQEKTSDTGTMELTDADNGLAGVSMRGNSFQYESTGKNLFYYGTNINSTQQGVNLTTDESYKIILNGTATKTAFFGFSFADKPIPAGTYRISFNNVQTNGDVSIKLANSSGDLFASVGATVQNHSQVATISKDCTSVTIRVGAGATLNNFVMQPMISTGEDAIPFEPYSGGEPGPNPDYPFPVQSVGDIPKDSNGVEIRNLLDEEALRNATLSDDLVVNEIVFNPGVYSMCSELSGEKLEGDTSVFIFSIDKKASGEGTNFVHLISPNSHDGISTKNLTVPEGSKAYLKIVNVKYKLEDICKNYHFMITTASEIDEYRPYIGENNGLIKIESQGKNLIDFTNWALNNSPDSVKTGENKVEITTLGNTNAVPYVFSENDIEVTLSCKLKTLEGTNYSIELLNSRNELVKKIYNDGSITGTASKIKLNYTGRGKASYEDVMLVKGSESLQFEPYHHSTTWVTLKEPLRKIGDVADEILKDGTVVQRIVKLTKTDFVKDAEYSKNGYTCFKTLSSNILYKVPEKGLSNYLTYIGGVWANDKEGIAISSANNKLFIKFKGDFEEIPKDDFKAYCALIAPTTYTIPRILVETYDPTTDITVQSETKPSMTVDYKIAISSILRRLEALEQLQVSAL